MKHIRLAQVLLGITTSALLFAACSTAPQATAPVPTARVGVESTTAPTQSIAAPTQGASAPTAATAAKDTSVREGIQQTLDLFARAYNEQDAELLKQTTDQTNLPFRRYVSTRFGLFQQSLFGGQVDFGYTVQDVTPLDLGFVRARVKRSWDGYVEDWLFREVDGTWLLSEPTEKQIGKREKIDSEHFTFYSYPWAEDVTPKLITLMEEAYNDVKQQLGKVPDQKTSITIKPIFGLPPPENPGVLAYYSAGRNPQSDRMVIFAPGSMIFSSYNPTTGWEPELRTVLVHEYVHQVNNRSFTPIARMSDWMVEGLADYVADNRREGSVAAAVRSGNIIPIVDATDRVNKQDLEHLTILEQDIPLAYGFSSSLVAYINETYGGMDGWWKFVESYDKAQNIDEALQEAFGVSYEQFDTDWRAWLQQKYS